MLPTSEMPRADRVMIEIEDNSREMRFRFLPLDGTDMTGQHSCHKKPGNNLTIMGSKIRYPIELLLSI